MVNSSDSTCRILVMSTTIEDARRFVQLLQELEGNTGVSPSLDTESPTNEIPWIIKNRYYSASVHFKLHPIFEDYVSERSVPSPQYEGVPAVIWVWHAGQVYQDHVERLQKEMGGCGAEPEVCLGVRILSPTDKDSVTPSDDDDAEIDTFLSSNGFEYVNATQQTAKPADPDAYSDGIPALPRVLDALGTIMWPSMESAPKGEAAKSTAGRFRERALLDWANASQGVVSEGDDLMQEDSTSAKAMKREMSELQRWLEESDEHAAKNDPWRSAVSTAALSSSPTAMDFGDPFNKETPKGGDHENKFDDDFTVFISAPPVEESNEKGNHDISGRSTPDLSRGGSLGVPGDGGLYRSLGSVSDFGGSDGPGGIDDDDEGLPTREEIEEASQKIFGKTKGSTSNRGAKGFDAISAEYQDDYDMAPFDLTRVLGTLQEMKAEIALIENEDERRKAAARVALGLVYGLEEE